MNCPLCQNLLAELFYKDQFREYFRCTSCTIIFVPRSSLISKEEEKERYDHHQNDEADPGYSDYFLKTVEPVMKEIRPTDRGLDFGCGRTRLMEKLFQEKGVEVQSFDPFYFPDLSLNEQRFDFAILNEVIEHLRDPRITLMELKKIVKGPIFVRTKIYPTTKHEFSNWFYKRDLTHVQFFSLKALEDIGEVKILDKDLYRIDWK